MSDNQQPHSHELIALQRRVAELERQVEFWRSSSHDLGQLHNILEKKYRAAIARQKKKASAPASATPGFDAFWATWPSNHRKVNKQKCLAKWIADDLEVRANEVVAHVKACARGADWTKDGGQFIPAPLVYLNQERYLAAPPPPVAVKSVGSLSGIQYRTDGVDEDGYFN